MIQKIVVHCRIDLICSIIVSKAANLKLLLNIDLIGQEAKESSYSKV